MVLRKKAIKQTCKLLEVKGNIIPVTYSNSHLVAKYANGQQVLGEHFIDEPNKKNGKSRIIELSLVPSAKANKDAINAILKADLIVFAPGDLFTSIICNLAVDGIASAIKKSTAKLVYIMNLMTKLGQTNGLTASGHIKILEEYLLGRKIDYCLLNKKLDISEKVLKKYMEEGAEEVQDDIGQSNGVKVIRGNFASNEIFENKKGDKLVRSLVRHDSERLAKAVFLLL